MGARKHQTRMDTRIKRDTGSFEVRCNNIYGETRTGNGERCDARGNDWEEKASKRVILPKPGHYRVLHFHF